MYGSSGVGKSTFAGCLARAVGAEHIEIDLLAYDPAGVHVPQELLRERFEEAIGVDRWVVEGMHRDQLHRALEQSDAFVWLDYPRHVVGRRLIGRMLRQLLLREQRHGRRTTLRSAWQRELPFVAKTLRSYPRRRDHGHDLAARATALGLRVERLPSPRAARRWLVKQSAGS